MEMNDILIEKTDSLLRCLRRIEDKRPETVDALIEDYDLQDILILNLERAVQQAVDIAMRILAKSGRPAPDTMRDSFAALREMSVITEHTALNMKHAVGFRNTAVHAYQQINWEIVYSIITEHVEDFREYLREVNRYAADSEKIS